jgi:hypothetical protein
MPTMIVTRSLDRRDTVPRRPHSCRVQHHGLILCHVEPVIGSQARERGHALGCLREASITGDVPHLLSRVEVNPHLASLPKC